MHTRREFLHSGLAAVALGLYARGGRAMGFEPPCPDTGAVPLGASGPIRVVTDSSELIRVGGLPFARDWAGDYFRTWNDIPFHTGENAFPSGSPPAPTEEVPLAIVGGGLSGLAAAYMLREHRPVVFELRNRFGGNSQGESWRGIDYSLGGAYFMSPDEGSFLERFYRELGLDHAHRLDDAPESAEFHGILQPDFWSAAGLPPEEQEAFQRYRALVTKMANDTYPEIPLPEGKNNQWILDLDGRSLQQDISERLGVPVPTLLASAIQSYCYSSFDAGWEELSAACGWNFIAAEEFGRWVCKGGNAHVVQELWDRLSRLERGPQSCPGRYLRAGCRVVDVRLTGGGRSLVTYRDAAGGWRSLLAKKVVFACSKHIAKKLIWNLSTIDPPKFDALWRVETRSYAVANVLVNRPMRHDLYDVFLLGDGQYPVNSFGSYLWWKVTDVVDGAFAEPHGHPNAGVMTIYWPLPSFEGRVRLAVDGSWNTHAAQIAPQIITLLGLYGLQPDDVRQVRLARWGHSMPIPRPGMIADGTAELLRRPINDQFYFVNQDNWQLPAFETCLLEARHFAPAISRGL